MNRSFEYSVKPAMTTSFSDVNKNIIIIVLCALLILSFAGINLLHILGNFMQYIVNLFGPVVRQLLSLIGYTTGSVIEKTADVATDVATAGVEVAGGTLQSLGNLLKTTGQGYSAVGANQPLDSTINTGRASKSMPMPSTSTNSIQNPIAASKAGWCLVGEYDGNRGCIEVNDSSKCLSGQIFPTQQLCVNPMRTPFTYSQAK
jgi:hypothetical protein